MSDDIPRRKLAELVTRFGPDLCDDPRRCEGLLRDVCGTHRREIFVLVSAVREGVGTELRQSAPGLPLEAVVARLTKRLHQNLGLAEDLARWGVESWAVALGVLSSQETVIRGQTVRTPGSGLDIDDDLFADFPRGSPEDTLRQALRRVLADGVVTDAERAEVAQLRRQLGVPNEVAARIVAEVKAEMEVVPAEIVTAQIVPKPAKTPRAPKQPPRPNLPAWLVTVSDFARATRTFWLSGTLNAVLPNLQSTARQQPEKDFLSDIEKLSAFLQQQKLPFFVNEALVAGGFEFDMRLTNYRMVLIAPNREVLVIPLPDVAQYTFGGAAGSFRGAIFGSVVEVTGVPGKPTWKWSGAELEGLHFPKQEVCRMLLRLQLWKALPAVALKHLRSRLP